MDGAILPGADHKFGTPVTIAAVGAPDGPGLDIDAMIVRFRERAEAVRRRGVPPVEGPERKRFIEQAQVDFRDFAMLGDATGTLEDGILTLRIDLRPEG